MTPKKTRKKRSKKIEELKIPDEVSGFVSHQSVALLERHHDRMQDARRNLSPEALANVHAADRALKRWVESSTAA